MLRLLLCFLLSVSVLSAQDTLRVGVKPMAPYTYQDEAGHWQGMAVDLWQQVAGEQQIVYEMIDYGAQDSLLAALENGDVDLVIAAQITAEDESVIDFMQSYHRSSLALALPPTNSLWSVVTGLVSMQFLYIVMGLSVLLLIVGTVVYLLEKNSNGDQFGGERTWWQGVGAGFWWAGVTMTTIGYGDKAPTSLPGRAVAMLWMLVALAVTSSLTAAIIRATDASTVVEFPRELKQKMVGVVEDSPASVFLDSRDQAYQTYSNAHDGLLALDRDEIEVFVHDATALRYLSSENSNLEVYVQETDARPRAFAFAVRDDSPFYESIGQAVIDITTTSGWNSLVRYYDEQSGGSGKGK